MTDAQAIAFVERHGVVLESAHHGTIPSLAEAVAGERLRGSWWAHAKGRAIFRATRAVRASPEVLVCRLVGNRISFAHARVWPALVRLADRIPHERLARVREVHTARGTHRVERTPFPSWVPAETVAAAKRLDPRDARTSLANVIDEIEKAAQ